MNLKKQRGMTLLEIIIVLGIIGTIAAGVVILAQRAYDSKAMTDLTTNINTIRTAMKDAYGSTGIYPLPTGSATAQLNDDTINETAGQATPIGKLIALGKLSRDEAKNNISNDYISAGAGNVSANGVQKGYFIEINGLNQQQCRNILLQAGNSFDYVEVTNDAPAGAYHYNTDAVDLAHTLSGVTAGTPGTGTTPGTPATLTGAGIFRSLAANGNTQITADGVITACNDDSSNSVVLGSR
ncbi:type IV pilus major pilin [Salmonella enterica]|uniref:Type IV pilus major pilin n=1 Tax=Salmonella enterica TaxID=28901 RepID=A0A5Y9S410_SALER|nr:type IV pilus major pilin [Salmonella enterica]EBL4322924.1 type IV pilus major pilin [Salmonella enterica subsp. enterica serovar Give]EEA0375946.1 type IV pilus major pilin [Salmonella enterica subsp. enterica serovar Newport]ECE3717815.1 type IV pilus major pilin [Salmonella enterica]ECL4764926.1 type IV pilus major pilin [Salmonella enterica]